MLSLSKHLYRFVVSALITCAVEMLRLRGRQMSMTVLINAVTSLAAEKNRRQAGVCVSYSFTPRYKANPNTSPRLPVAVRRWVAAVVQQGR
jgi:hypothetical protein